MLFRSLKSLVTSYLLDVLKFPVISYQSEVLKNSFALYLFGCLSDCLTNLVFAIPACFLVFLKDFVFGHFSDCLKHFAFVCYPDFQEDLVGPYIYLMEFENLVALAASKASYLMAASAHDDNLAVLVAWTDLSFEVGYLVALSGL